ncbi:MAG: alpha/beta fold hydrolase [Candidatus Acidiferrales bacterium]
MRRLLKLVARVAAGLLLGSVATWAASSFPLLSPAPATDCLAEQVALRTADGTLLDGVLYQPAANPRPTAILLVHGFGSNFYSGYFPFFARTAAAQGYATLALNMRDHDTGPKVSDFADNEMDIAAGLDCLRKLGYARFVLLGQSMGTNRVLYYQAATRDPSIPATVLVSGPGNLFEWNVWQLGREKAQASVDEALKIQAAGHEQQFMLVDLGPLGKALYTARYLLSLRGPKARSDPYQNIQKLKNRILIVQGTADKLVEPSTADRLKRAAASSPAVDLIFFEGADHSFRGQETLLAQRILAWIKEAAP